MSGSKELAIRREKVADYYFKGYKPREIAEKCDLTLPQVRADIHVIKGWLSAKTIKRLEYRKNRSLAKIELAQRKAWGIWEANASYPNIQLSAQRVIKELLELEARVEGVIAEKLIVEPDREASKLMEELRKIEKEANKGNGHEEPVNAESGS